MVTAGIFMVHVCRRLFEYSDTALSFVLVIAPPPRSHGLLGVVNNDIKRVTPTRRLAAGDT